MSEPKTPTAPATYEVGQYARPTEEAWKEHLKEVVEPLRRPKFSVVTSILPLLGGIQIRLQSTGDKPWSWTQLESLEEAQKRDPTDRESWDPEVVELCDALNMIPTVRTLESCCGHGKEPFLVWFTCTNMKFMWVLGRALDPRYGGAVGFQCVLDTGDKPGGPTFRCESVLQLAEGKTTKKRLSDRGESSYKASKELAARIRALLSDQGFRSHYGL